MIKFENTEVFGWEAAIRGMRNPMNSWAGSDSYWTHIQDNETLNTANFEYFVGENDLVLMKKLVKKAGSDHRKFMRMINVTVDITAPLYWWKEFDTYKVGTVANSCSTMHKIHEKEFTLEDFSCEHLEDEIHGWIKDANGNLWCSALTYIEVTVNTLNAYRYQYLETKDKKYWWAMIQLLPSSYNQKRTIQLNYEVLANIYKSRRNHKLDEWSIGFMDWIKGLPYSELITGGFDVQE